MTKEEKFQIVEALSQKLAGSDYFYIVDAGSMTVAETNKFRRACFNKGVEYLVAKNTLIAKALENLGTVDYTEFNKNVLKGFSGIMISPESGNLPGKILQEYRKGMKKNRQLPVLKGASVDGALFFGGDSQLETLANIKSKNELIGDVIGMLQAPAQNVVSALKNSGGTILGILQTLEEKNA